VIISGLAIDASVPRNFLAPPLAPAADTRADMAPSWVWFGHHCPLLTVRACIASPLGARVLTKASAWSRPKCWFQPGLSLAFVRIVPRWRGWPKFDYGARALDVKLHSGTYLGLEGALRRSDENNTIGVFQIGLTTLFIRMRHSRNAALPGKDTGTLGPTNCSATMDLWRRLALHAFRAGHPRPDLPPRRPRGISEAHAESPRALDALGLQSSFRIPLRASSPFGCGKKPAQPPQLHSHDGQSGNFWPLRFAPQASRVERRSTNLAATITG